MRLTDQIIDGEHAIEVLNSFLAVNKGDEATQHLILAIFCELFDCSEDTLIQTTNH